MSDPLPPDATIVIVGASLAGLRAAEEARHEGHRGPVVVVGEEQHAPYDRPPLSKQFLAGAWDVDRIRHRAPDSLDALGIELRLGCRAVALDIERAAVSLDDGSVLDYGGLVVATGATPRLLPGTEDIAGVHTLRTLDDCERLRRDVAAAGAGARVVVIGAGFIGAEVAATCRGLGCEVTILEALATPLAKVLGEEIGRVCADLHADHGVTVRTGVGVERVASAASDSPAPSGRAPDSPTACSPTPDGASPDSYRPLVVHLDTGELLHADVVVVGIGVRPTVGWLEGSGLVVDDGVVCDEMLFATTGTSETAATGTAAATTPNARPNVVAAGDVARWMHPVLGRSLRVEHWTNAAEGGAAAMRNLVAGHDRAQPYAPVPFFWSDQYRTKIQLVGDPSPDDEVVVVDGPDADAKLVALYRRGDRLSAAVAFGRPRQLMSYRPVVAAGGSFDEAIALSRA